MAHPVQTAAGGQAVVITNTNGQQFYVSVTHGTVQATPASGGPDQPDCGRVDTVTYLEINQIIPMHSPKEGAHTFNSTLGQMASSTSPRSRSTTGTIISIEGYHDAVLSGPMRVSSTSTGQPDRLHSRSSRAARSASAATLDTLDILNDADFSKSTGLSVGQDLNWFDLGGNLTFENGANMIVGRDLGLSRRSAKGSGNAGQGLFVNGNFTVSAQQSVAIGRNLESRPASSSTAT